MNKKLRTIKFYNLLLGLGDMLFIMVGLARRVVHENYIWYTFSEVILQKILSTSKITKEDRWIE